MQFNYGDLQMAINKTFDKAYAVGFADGYKNALKKQIEVLEKELAMIEKKERKTA